MAARGNIVLTDAAGTPVNHTFYAVPSKDGLEWVDRTQAIFAGQPRLRLTQRVATRDARHTKVVWALDVPVLEQASGSTSSGLVAAPTVAYRNAAEITFLTHDRSTLQERKDLLAMARDLIDEAIVTSQVHDGDMIW